MKSMHKGAPTQGQRRLNEKHDRRNFICLFKIKIVRCEFLLNLPISYIRLS